MRALVVFGFLLSVELACSPPVQTPRCSVDTCSGCC